MIPPRETAAQRWARWKTSEGLGERCSNQAVTRREKRRKAQRASVVARRRNRRLRMQTLSMEWADIRKLEDAGRRMIEEGLASGTQAATSSTDASAALVGTIFLNLRSIAVISAAL